MVMSPVLAHLLWAPLWAVCLSLHRQASRKFQVRRGENGRDPQGHRRICLPQSTAHCPFRAFALRSRPWGGPPRTARAGQGEGLGRVQSRSHERERLGPKPLWPRDSSLVGGRVPACAGSTPASAWAEGLTGPLLLLSSEQRRPRCVCRSEIKQMTFIGKAIFFSTMFICQKNRL